MSIFSKAASAVANFVGGDVLGAAKELALKYLPPDMSPAEKADFEFKFADLARQKSLDAGTLANNQLQLELADIQSARAMQAAALAQDDRFSKRFIYYFATFWSLFAALYIAFITFGTIPAQNVRFADTNLGFVLGTIVATMVQYFYGSSRGSKIKDELIKQMQPTPRGPADDST